MLFLFFLRLLFDFFVGYLFHRLFLSNLRFLSNDRLYNWLLLFNKFTLGIHILHRDCHWLHWARRLLVYRHWLGWLDWLGHLFLLHGLWLLDRNCLDLPWLPYIIHDIGHLVNHLI